jgi:hypothetical protein
LILPVRIENPPLFGPTREAIEGALEQGLVTGPNELVDHVVLSVGASAVALRTKKMPGPRVIGSRAVLLGAFEPAPSGWAMRSHIDPPISYRVWPLVIAAVVIVFGMGPLTAAIGGGEPFEIAILIPIVFAALFAAGGSLALRVEVRAFAAEAAVLQRFLAHVIATEQPTNGPASLPPETTSMAPAKPSRDRSEPPGRPNG